MECPTCFQRIIVPQSPATDDVQLIIKGSKATRRLATKPGTDFRMPPAPALPAKDSPVAGIAFVILLCAVIAVVFVFRREIFKSTGDQTGGQTNPVASAPNEKKMPQATTSKPIVGLASVVFAKGDSIMLESGIAEAEVKDPAKATFLAAFKADLAHPLVFDGLGDFSIFPGYSGPSPGAAGNIRWNSSFQGGLIISVTLQGLIPDHKYLFTLDGDPQLVGNNNLVDLYQGLRRYYDFSTVTTDMTGSYHATFGVMLPASQYDVSFYVKDTTNFKIVLTCNSLQFTVE